MEPTIASLHQVDELETQFSVLFPQKGLIGLEVLPLFPRDFTSGTFYKFDKRDMFRKHQTFKDPSDGEANIVRWKPTTDTYSCQLHALKNVVSRDKQALGSRQGVDPVRYGNKLVIQSLMNEVEFAIASKVRDAAVITQNVDLSTDPTTQFNDFQNSRPRIVFKDARKAMIFKRPNRAIVPYDVLETLRIHPDVLAAFQMLMGEVSDEQVRNLLRVEKMLIPDALEDTADDTSVTGTYSNPWARDILFYYVDPTITLETITFGWSPSWNMPGTANLIEGMESGTPWRVRNYRSDKKGGGGSDTWETEGYFDQKIVAPELAYLIRNAIAA